MSPLPWVPFLISFLLCTQYVNAEDQALNLPPLYQNDKSPCVIMNEVASSSSCTTNQRRAVLLNRYRGERDVDVANPIPTLCTCNERFFNLWTACALMLNTNSTTLPTIPSFDTWQQSCASKQIDIDASTEWVSTEITTREQQQVKNGTLDVMEALAEDTKKPKWTLLQKLLPFITGVGVIFVACIAFLIYRHRRGRHMRTWKAFPRSKDVHKIDRSSTWTIDQFETGYEDFIFVDPEVPISPAATSSEGHNPQSFGVASSTLKEQATPAHAPLELRAERQIPGKATWRNVQLPESVLSLPQWIPWKKKPILVQHVPHTRRFRVDDYDKSTDASSSRRATSNFSHGTHGTTLEGSAAAFSRNHATIEEEDESEQTSLITPLERSENSVFLISRVPGVDFSSEAGSSHPHTSTVNSHINVQSPTPTTATPTTAGSQPFRPNQSSPLAAMTIPPVPTLPAPAPPESGRWIPKPIPEEDEYNSPYSFSSFTSHARNLSDNMSYLPSHIERRPPSSSVNEYGRSANSSSLNDYGILATPSDHSPHNIDDTESYFSQQQGHSRGPSIDSLLRPSPASLPRLITHEDAVGRRLRAIPSAVASVDGLQPPIGHHRNISAESLVPNPNDPIMLFPGSARSAGYMSKGSASVSSESLYSQHSQQPSLKIQPNRRPSS
ncbi:hypothetical protein BDQ17DRAFT_1359577 [Cyathus striatus]|nr:hypothetical protein BDQ17DRAFT_1359577 [Cyathus striatus]